MKYISDYLNKKINKLYKDWDVTIALRYLPIVNLIKKNIPNNARVLDVGSSDLGLRVYLDGKYLIYGTDIAIKKDNPKLNLYKASAEKLPFKPNYFEFVSSVDMLEHLSPKIREASIREMIRVSSSYVYVVYPSGKFSTVIDTFISWYYQKTHKSKFDFLVEHKTNGLPDMEIVKQHILKSAKKLNKKVKINRVGNTNSFMWVSLLLLGFSENKYLTNIYTKMLLVLPFLQVFNFWPYYRSGYLIKIQK